MRIILNAALSMRNAWIAERDGRQWLVGPVVAVIEGILNHKRFLPASEIARSVQAWEGIPVTLRHPVEDPSDPLSDFIPDRQIVGEFRNVHLIEGRKLAGEIWIDIQKVRNQTPEAWTIIERATQGDVIEVSTGYFGDVEPLRGVFNGDEFEGVQRNIRPWHLAILPDQIGACSVTGGCGFPRVNAKQERSVMKVQNGKRLGEILSRVIGERVGNGTTKDQLISRLASAADTSVEKVQEAMEGKIDFPPNRWLQAWASALEMDFADLKMAADVDTIPLRDPNSDVPAGLVQNVKEFVKSVAKNIGLGVTEPSTKTPTKDEEEKAMNEKEKLIAQIVKNSKLSECQAKELNSLDEATLKALAAGQPETKTENQGETKEKVENQGQGKPPAEKSGEAVKTENKEETSENSQQPLNLSQLTEEQLLSIMPEKFRNAFSGLVAAQDHERTKLANALKANNRCVFSNEQIDAMTIDQLQSLDKQLKPASYLGAAAVPMENRDQESTELNELADPWADGAYASTSVQ